MELSPRAARNRGEYKRLSIYTIAASILAAACIVALIFTVWFTAVIIDDRGMEPTLERGDTVLCDKLAHTFSSPKRGTCSATARFTAAGYIWAAWLALRARRSP